MDFINRLYKRLGIRNYDKIRKIEKIGKKNNSA